MDSNAKIGTTSYGYRYLLMDDRQAPPLTEIIRRVAAMGLDTFQVCENARPLGLSRPEWRDAVNTARDCNVGLRAGCMTLSVETLSRYMELAAAIPDDQVRIVMEDEQSGPPSRGSIEAFLEAAAPRVEAAGMTLAIENHFHIPCRMLADVVAPFPLSLVGFCIDTANSLRNWEPADQVFALLDSRALQYHLKDYKVRGTNVGFCVGGAPLGEGDLDLAACVRLIEGRHGAPRVFLENWTPSVGNREADTAADAEWLSRSLAQARRSFEAGARASR